MRRGLAAPTSRFGRSRTGEIRAPCTPGWSIRRRRVRDVAAPPGRGPRDVRRERDVSPRRPGLRGQHRGPGRAQRFPRPGARRPPGRSIAGRRRWSGDRQRERPRAAAAQRSGPSNHAAAPLLRAGVTQRSTTCRRCRCKRWSPLRSPPSGSRRAETEVRCATVCRGQRGNWPRRRTLAGVATGRWMPRGRVMPRSRDTHRTPTPTERDRDVVIPRPMAVDDNGSLDLRRSASAH